MRIPILHLQKREIKTATPEAFLSKGKHVPSSIISASLHMLLRNFRFVCLILMLLIGTFCAYAVFGVCADDYFPRNENTWVLFLDMLPILSSAQLKTGNQPTSKRISSNQKSWQWTSDWNRISYFLFHFVEPKMSHNGQYYLTKTFKKAISRVR